MHVDPALQRLLEHGSRARDKQQQKEEEVVEEKVVHSKNQPSEGHDRS